MNLSLRPILRLAAGASIAGALSLTSCAEDAVEAYCNASCGNPGPPDPPDLVDHCIATFETMEHVAAHASCSNAFSAYLRCEATFGGPQECDTMESCTPDYDALAACIGAHEPGDACVGALARTKACFPDSMEAMANLIPICSGSAACGSWCVENATCDELGQAMMGMATGVALEDTGFVRCLEACDFAQPLGVVGPLDGD